MVSGKYLGPLISEVIRRAADSKLFSDRFLGIIREKDGWETSEVNGLLKGITGLKDRYTVKCIRTNMIRRAAKLISIVFSALAIKSNTDSICVVAEGLTFYKLRGLKKWTKIYLKKYLKKNTNINVTIERINDAVLKGVAALALLKVPEQG